MPCHCWFSGRKGIRPVKNWVVGCWRGCLGWGAVVHIAQQMPLPLTVSCSSKSRLVLTFLVLPFWYLLTRVVPDIFQKSSFQKSSKAVVCVCVVGFWHGHLSEVMCRFAYGPADAIVTHYLLLQKILVGFTFLVPAHPGSQSYYTTCVTNTNIQQISN